MIDFVTQDTEKEKKRPKEKLHKSAKLPRLQMQRTKSALFTTNSIYTSFEAECILRDKFTAIADFLPGRCTVSLHLRNKSSRGKQECGEN